jgi:predicted metal-dependent hydrolase
MDSAREHHLFQKGLEAFNSARFYDAHEEWEEVWLQTPHPERMFLQGLIQVAAAYHHYLRSNLRGTRTLLREGTAKLEPFPEIHRGIEVGRLRHVTRRWLLALDGGETPGADEIPLIEIRAADKI